MVGSLTWGRVGWQEKKKKLGLLHRWWYYGACLYVTLEAQESMEV
jgi:hypothetical protein